jgi:hypothetical protein
MPPEQLPLESPPPYIPVRPDQYPSILISCLHLELPMTLDRTRVPPHSRFVSWGQGSDTTPPLLPTYEAFKGVVSKLTLGRCRSMVVRDFTSRMGLRWTINWRLTGNGIRSRLSFPTATNEQADSPHTHYPMVRALTLCTLPCSIQMGWRELLGLTPEQLKS